MLGIQFFISLILLICSFTIVRQTRFIQNTPLGFNRNMLEIRAPIGSDMSKMVILKNTMQEIPGVQSSSLCSGNPISDNMIVRYDLGNGTFYTPYIFIGDRDYLKTTGLQLIQGEAPSEENVNGKLVNEAFVKYFDLKDPLGAQIPGTESDYITGIVKDFNISSLQQAVPPSILSIHQNLSTLIARIDMEQLGSILPRLETCWKNLYPSYPFRYLLMDEELMNKHKDDLVFSKIIIASTILSMMITGFGLFALSWGTMQERTKEIGIRKVVGASSVQIAALLLGSYIKIILFASLAAIPAALYLMNHWLEKFAFRVDVDMPTLVICGLIILSITALTVGYHTLKSSMQNPVDVLRYE